MESQAVRRRHCLNWGLKKGATGSFSFHGPCLQWEEIAQPASGWAPKILTAALKSLWLLSNKFHSKNERRALGWEGSWNIWSLAPSLLQRRKLRSEELGLLEVPVTLGLWSSGGPSAPAVSHQPWVYVLVLLSSV